MMEAHIFVTIDRWGKCRLSTAPHNTGNDGTTAGLPQALAQHPLDCVLRAPSAPLDSLLMVGARLFYMLSIVHCSDCLALF